MKRKLDLVKQKERRRKIEERNISRAWWENIFKSQGIRKSQFKF